MIIIICIRFALLTAGAIIAFYGAFNPSRRNIDYVCLSLFLMMIAMILRQFQ